MPKLPGVNHLRAVKALEKAGFQIDRQGKHIFMSKGSIRVVGATQQSSRCLHNGRNCAWCLSDRRAVQRSAL